MNEVWCMKAIQYLLMGVRKALVAFVSAFFLPYITIFITKLLQQESSRVLLGDIMEDMLPLVVLMGFVAIGSFVIEFIYGKKGIQIPFLYLGVHGLYVAVVMGMYIQGWVYVAVGFIMGIIFVIFDRLFNYWAAMVFYYKEDTKE